jgi:hypothetical protein
LPLSQHLLASMAVILLRAGMASLALTMLDTQMAI